MSKLSKWHLIFDTSSSYSVCPRSSQSASLTSTKIPGLTSKWGDEGSLRKSSGRSCKRLSLIQAKSLPIVHLDSEVGSWTWCWRVLPKSSSAPPLNSSTTFIENWVSHKLWKPVCSPRNVACLQTKMAIPLEMKESVDNIKAGDYAPNDWLDTC